MSLPASPELRSNPLLAPAALLLVGISLSIGWGIRGNYGHETGAMLPGALAAIAVCLLSRRNDWQERVAYFACLGALGWGCGGSISYMQIISYTYSGHAPTQYFGFWGLFLIGFLWAAVGTAGTALPAVLTRKNLQDLFKPLTMLLGVWAVLYFVERPLTRLAQSQLAAHFLEVMPLQNVTQRHELALYWFDSDWIAAAVFLAAILAYDLIDRKFQNGLWLPVFALAGAAFGFIAHLGLAGAGLTIEIEQSFVRYYGDAQRVSTMKLDSNWPAAFLLLSGYAGIALGLFSGVAAYFYRFGKFRSGSALFLHMALGWFAGFILFPVLLDIRMTPPRGDNWAGIVGMVAGALIYFAKNQLQSVAKAAIIGGTIGGIGFSGIACTEAILESFGNKYIADVPGLAEAWTEWQQMPTFADPPAFAQLLKNQEFLEQFKPWAHWHAANWHSFLEQSYGFVNGLAVVIALAFLVKSQNDGTDKSKRLHWPEIIAITVVVPALIYVNMVKNLKDWTDGAAPALQPVMKSPFIDFSLSAFGWFNLIYGFGAVVMVLLMSIHVRRRIAIVPATWLGRGQLLFFVILWSFAIGNFGKALSGFGEQRLLTEGVILVNSVVAMLLILLVPSDDLDGAMLPSTTAPDYSTPQTPRNVLWGAVVFAVVSAAVIPPVEAFTVRSIYGNAYAGTRGKNFRFGPKATWKHAPHIKGQPEKPTAW
ncbi:MAG: hypothetical protein AB7O26_07815 [Planctomycetaceae bacterium]